MLLCLISGARRRGLLRRWLLLFGRPIRAARCPLRAGWCSGAPQRFQDHNVASGGARRGDLHGTHRQGGAAGGIGSGPAARRAARPCQREAGQAHGQVQCSGGWSGRARRQEMVGRRAGPRSRRAGAAWRIGGKAHRCLPCGDSIGGRALCAPRPPGSAVRAGWGRSGRRPQQGLHVSSRSPLYWRPLYGTCRACPGRAGVGPVAPARRLCVAAPQRAQRMVHAHEPTDTPSADASRSLVVLQPPACADLQGTWCPMRDPSDVV